jgi:hypothetical protein
VVSHATGKRFAQTLVGLPPFIAARTPVESCPACTCVAVGVGSTDQNVPILSVATSANSVAVG